ncbi:TIGR04104 family putative zinc finger protein [Ornithinibacillus halotolerans]|uniref:TIGR04104 family putative zinc finger protein n=1 Tax=Ornithinibacillus halotolerans TaxID=1274357 RepID=UPI00166F0A47|nr:TIGR04104 family putative zinc finger protein [Ornithinibacillus halotolerans]
MPTCQNCSKEWKWKQTFKKSFTIKSYIECPYCSEKQYLTAKTRKRSTLPAFIAPLVLFLKLIFNIPIIIVLFILIGVLLATLALYPYIIELSNEEEPLW